MPIQHFVLLCRYMSSRKLNCDRYKSQGDHSVYPEQRTPHMEQRLWLFTRVNRWLRNLPHD